MDNKILGYIKSNSRFVFEKRQNIREMLVNHKKFARAGFNSELFSCKCNTIHDICDPKHRDIITVVDGHKLILVNA